MNLILASDYSKLGGIGFLFGIPMILGAFVTLALARIFHGRGHAKSRMAMAFLTFGLSILSLPCFLFEASFSLWAYLLIACSGIFGALGVRAFFEPRKSNLPDRFADQNSE